VIDLEPARDRILAAVQPLSAESLPLLDAAGRYLAETVVSSLDLPPFDNSGMDGYALRAEDVVRAAADRPVSLRVIGRVPAGSAFSGSIAAGECVRLFTGSPLPKGADAVVMQEDTSEDPAGADKRLFLAEAKPWENVRFKGEDVKRGEVLVQEGHRLRVAAAGLLAATGLAKVSVGRRPLVGLIATGSELKNPGESLQPGEIYESNRICLAGLAESTGAQPRIYPLVPDDLASTRSALLTAFSECDAVITSGGASVGEFDLVKDAFQELGGALDFWKVAIKPGKPFVLGIWKGKLLFGLPGNPVSAFVTFLLLVRPALLKFQGAADTGLPSRPGVLAQPLMNRGDRRHFMRVNWTDSGEVQPAGTQGSHYLLSLARADGLVDVPPNTTIPAATKVCVLGWGPD
jgi:molybdopterin molybdotransferase